MRRLVFSCFLLVLTSAHSADIKSVRTWAAPERTRVVFDVAAAVDYHVFTMRGPDRVVIDFKHAAPRSKLVLPVHDSPRLRRLRYARRGDDGLRVVLDMKMPVEVRDLLLPPNKQYGHRLVLDLFSEPPPIAAPPPNPRAQSTAEPRDVVVAIDAGHGGDDVGAIGPSGVYEKDIVLALSQELAQHINQQPGMRAVLTRKSDYYLKLRTRMDKAREERADLFISIHADAFRDPKVRGSSVYVLSQRGASSEAAAWLADNENASDLVGGITLEDKDDVLKSVLLDLSQTASIEASILAANHVLESLKDLAKLHRKRVQHAGFVVLKSPDIPSILIETAFISNPTEEKRLRSQAYRTQLAASIFEGVLGYFQDNAPPDTRIAVNRRHRVVPGDTLLALAQRYAVSMESIKLANNMHTEMLHAGAVLTIP